MRGLAVDPGSARWVPALLFQNPNWLTSSISPAVPSRAAIRSAHYDCGTRRLFLGSEDGGAAYVKVDNIAGSWQGIDTAGAFPASDTLEGIAGSPQGPVRVEFSVADVNCAYPMPFSLPAGGPVRYVRSVNFRALAARNPVIAGVRNEGNISMRVRAGVKIENPGQ